MFRKPFRDNILLKIMSLNGASLVLRIGIGIVVSKMIAVYIGTQGMALLGNFKNFIRSVQALSVLGTYNGVIKYVAEFKNNTNQLSRLFATLFYIGIPITLIISVGLYWGAEYWDSYVFGGSNNFHFIFKFLAFVMPFYVFHAFLFAIMNGLSNYKTYILSNFIGNSIYFLVTILMIIKYKLEGALFGVLIIPLGFLTANIILLRKDIFNFRFPRFELVSMKFIKGLGVFGIMSLFSELLMPLVILRIRKYLITYEGIDQAGVWEGLQQLSAQYLLFVTTLFTIYLLPRLSDNKTDKGFREEVLQFYKSILPIVMVGMLLLYVLRKYVILVLFSKEFMPMESLFFWQLLGDFFKIMAITIAYQLVAKKMVGLYLLTEAISLCVIYGTSIYFITLLGVQGVVKAHAFSYFVYLLILLFVFRKPLFFLKTDYK